VSTQPVLKTEELHVWFDLSGGRELHAVQGVSFELRPGERMGLVGESGCGKTTTILALMGLLPASSSVGGRVYLNGEDMLAKGEETVSPHRWRDVAMVFQGAMNAFNPVKTIGEQIVEPMELHGTASGRAALPTAFRGSRSTRHRSRSTTVPMSEIVRRPSDIEGLPSLTA
jgi:ABC-type glutathione transport system ATPase component